MTTAVRRASRWTPIGIAATILGFAVWWPLGLASVGYILWGGSFDDLFNDGLNKVKDLGRGPQASSGNAAFDEYRRETLHRLEEEQAQFDEFVTNLRQARDREEFERFMADRNEKSFDG